MKSAAACTNQWLLCFITTVRMTEMNFILTEILKGKLGFIQKQKMGLNSSQQRHYCKPYNFTIPNIIYKIKFMAYFPFLKFHCSGLKHFPMLCFMFVRGQAFHAGRLFTNPKIGLPDVRLLGF